MTTPDDRLPTANIQLLRALGPGMATAVVVGSVIGSGVFKKPATVAGDVAAFAPALMAWILGGLFTLFGALALGEIAGLFPKAGGNFTYLSRAYGRPIGFLWGWCEFFVIRAGALAALAVIVTESAHDAVRPADGSDAWPTWLIGTAPAAVVLVFALVNARGVSWGGWLQLVLTTLKCATLAAVIGLPFVLGQARPENLTLRPPEDRPLTLMGFAAALIAVRWAYHGWMDLAPLAEEVREPQRNLPIALIAGTLIIIALYLGANLAYAVVLTQDELAATPSTTTVAAEFCRRLLGPIGARAVAAAIALSALGALNGGLLSGPRPLYAMAAEGLAPRALAAVHPVYATPAAATLALALWTAALVLGAAALVAAGVLSPGKSHFDVLTDYAMFGALVFETMAVGSVFVFRRTMPNEPRPYRCVGYPIVPATYVGVMLCVLATYFFSPEKAREAIGATLLVAAGAAVYWGGGLSSRTADPSRPAV